MIVVFWFLLCMLPLGAYRSFLTRRPFKINLKHLKWNDARSVEIGSMPAQYLKATGSDDTNEPQWEGQTIRLLEKSTGRAVVLLGSM